TARRAAAPHGGITRLFERVFGAGELLSREEFVALRAVAPLYAEELVNAAKDVLAEVEATRRTIATLRRPHLGVVGSLVRTYARSRWAAAHVSVLMAAWVGALPEFQPQPSADGMAVIRLSDGVTSLAARLLWSETVLRGKDLEPMQVA